MEKPAKKVLCMKTIQLIQPANRLSILRSASFAVFLASSASAANLYVDLNSPNSTPPFSDWSTAATNIQDAIDAAAAADTIFVTNGVYAAGGKVMAGDLTNRVALDKEVTVQSVNGPWFTTIRGDGATNGTAAVRCAWITNGAALQGFTLTAGATRMGGDSTNLQCGGAAWCVSSNASVRNCLMISNVANYGGGAYRGNLQSCGLLRNRATVSGSAAAYTALLNCTVVSNLSAQAMYYGRLTNCIVFYNIGGLNLQSTYSYCCTQTLPTGEGNFITSPQLSGDALHLTSGSPCRGTGTNLVTGTDIDGQPWANPPSVGCDEWQPSPAILGPPSIRFGSDPLGFAINVTAIGQEPFQCFWTKDGSPIVDDAHFSFSQTTNLLATRINPPETGSYQVVVSNSFGAVTSAVVQMVVRYVDAAGVAPGLPYLNWASAATNIQDAINAASPGDIVLVTNGSYSFGGKVMVTDLTNRVALTKPIRVQSVNGPWVTIILGNGPTNGTAAVRCAWLADDASLVGFTLARGATRTVEDTLTLQSGGGVWCASANASVANCILKTNTASVTAAAAYGGTFKNCLIASNSVVGFGAIVTDAQLNSCTVVSNRGTGIEMALASQVRLTNCIVYFNNVANYSGGSFAYCCATPLPPGSANFTNNPDFFLDGVHLNSTSPCRDTGTNLTAGTDIFGQPWANPPSLGCAQWQRAPSFFLQPKLQLTSSPTGFKISAWGSGQAPLTYFWMHDGIPISEDGHFTTTTTTNLVVVGIKDSDAGSYRIVVSNAFGIVTSEVAQVTLHFVDAAGANPLPPYLNWASAATNIQDAIDAASPNEILRVTNGVYAAGGKVMAGDLTNRVAVDKALTVLSVNGFASTVIQGVRDPATTNGPAAVRCAWLTNGALLSGFTLRNGATRAAADVATLQSGGGVWGTSSNALVSNCLLTNNAAVNGAGVAYGALRNSILIGNVATTGGGAYYAFLNNCVVQNNYCGSVGAGTYYGRTRNSIVIGNYRGPFFSSADYYPTPPDYAYCCTSSFSSPATGNILASPKYLDDAFHLPAVSPCRGAGNSLYASGTDNDGESWANPPSIGCDEVVDANLVGPLSVAIQMPTLVFAPPQSSLINHLAGLYGLISGRATRIDWDFGDGMVLTNQGFFAAHTWTNPGDYTVTFTAYNFDNPGGVSTNLLVHVLPLVQPVLESAIVTNNTFQFSFSAQAQAYYTIQYATNLLPPVTWQTLYRPYSYGGTIQITDSATNAARFYRVLVQ